MSIQPSSPPLSYVPAPDADFRALKTLAEAIFPLGPFTVATLPVADASYLYRLATVTDLFGARATRVRCEKITVGGQDLFYWQPSSSDSFADLTVETQNITIGALTMPTSINLIGNIAPSVARTVTLANGAFPGQAKELRVGGVLGALSSLNILGLGLGSGVALVAGGYAKWSSDWSTGLPVWKRIA